MKIAFYMTTVLEQLGGFEKSFIEIAKGLQEYTNAEVEIVTMDKQTTQRINSLLSIYFKKDLRGLSNGREDFSTIQNMLGGVKYKQFHTFKDLRQHLSLFDIVYSKNELIESFVFKFLVGYKNLNSIIFLCGTTLFYPSAESITAKLHNLLYGSYIYKFLASGVNGFHTKNTHDLKILEKHFSHKFLATIPNPFDFDRMYKLAEISKLNIIVDQKKYNVLWAARLTEQKGVPDLIKIINEVSNKKLKKKIDWWIAGDGELNDELRSKLENNKNVHVLGHVSSLDMPKLYSLMDVFLMTSKWESFGNTIVEAQAFDLPTIAYNITGPNELINQGHNGYLVSNHSTFVTRLITMIEENKELKSFKKQCIEKYGIRSVSIQLLELFELFTTTRGAKKY